MKVRNNFEKPVHNKISLHSVPGSGGKTLLSNFVFGDVILLKKNDSRTVV